MKLIYAQGACSLSVHILLEEMGLPYEAIRVGLDDKTVLESYNPKSYVPALELADGEIMTEATSILQYVAVDNGSAFLPTDPKERARCIEWMTFFSTEIHKGVAPLFHKEGLKEEFLKEVKEKINMRLEYLETRLEGHKFLMGKLYTVADMYALAILRIAEHVGVSFEEYPAIGEYKKSLEARAAVKKVLKVESAAPVETKPRFDLLKREMNSSSIQGSAH